MARDPKYSLVELFETSGSGAHCGYCNGNGSVSDGMWGYRLTVADYQNLLQRGWRRSGKYIYKPIMQRTCCPQYAIRCEALQFQLSKSQKKVLKKVYRFLAFGVGDDKITSSGVSYRSDGSQNDSNEDSSDVGEEMDGEGMSGESFMQVDEPKKPPDLEAFDLDAFHGKQEHMESTADGATTQVKKDGKILRQASDPSHPLARKKKDIRKERTRQKLLEKGLDPEVEERTRQLPDQSATLESYLDKPMPDNPKHNLVIRLVMLGDQDPYFAESFEETFRLYKKYELSVHKKESDRPTEKQFTRFLAESPLQYQMATGQSVTDSRPALGSFHMHYILDGKLIGVDVLDILPDCVTSVYFFYDPAFRYLSLGTYSVLREIAMVRELNRQFPDIQYASLGFYVHSCPKMQYKAKFKPSFLLCPEIYAWYPLDTCLAKLTKTAYHRLGTADGTDEDGDMESFLNEALILYKGNLMTFDLYKLTLLNARKPSPAEMKAEIDRVSHYGKLVGRKCLPGMALYCR